MNLADLSKPFDPFTVNFRVGATNADKTKGIALAYLDARAVMERLDEVCGVDGWQCRYPFIGCCDIGIYIPPTGEDAKATSGYHIPGQWVWKSNGAGQSDIEAEKGQYSDAFKRAAVLWGIGRYLYDLPNTWFPLEPHGRSYGFSEATQGELMKRLQAWQDKRFAIWDSKETAERYVTQIRAHFDGGNIAMLDVLLRELSPEQASDVWRHFPASLRTAIKADLETFRSKRNG